MRKIIMIAVFLVMIFGGAKNISDFVPATVIKTIDESVFVELTDGNIHEFIENETFFVGQSVKILLTDDGKFDRLGA